MSTQLYSQQFIAIAPETVRNVAELVPTIVLKASLDSIVQLKRMVEKDIIQGTTRDSLRQKYFTGQEVEGNIKSRIEVRDIGAILKGIFGQPTSTTALGATTHNFIPLNAVGGNPTVNLPTYTIFIRDGVNGIIRYRGCSFSKGKISIGNNVCEIDATVMGLDQALIMNATEVANILVAVSNTFAIPPSNQFLFGNVVTRYADTIANLATGTVLNVLPGIELEFDNDSKFDGSSSSSANQLNTNFNVMAGDFSSKISLSGYSTAANQPMFNAFYSPITANQSRCFEISLQNIGSGTIGTSSLFPTLRFTLNKSLIEYEKSESDGYLAFNLTLEPENPTATNSIQVTLINSTTTY